MLCREAVICVGREMGTLWGLTHLPPSHPPQQAVRASGDTGIKAYQCWKVGGNVSVSLMLEA